MTNDEDARDRDKDRVSSADSFHSAKDDLVVVAGWGAFDGTLHPGHLYYLERCMALGPLTIFLLNNQRIILQKHRRPILDEEERAENLMRTGLVNRVIISSSDARHNLQMTVRFKPKIYCFGKDQGGPWNDTLEAALRKIGTQLLWIPSYHPEKYSTTRIYFSQ